MDLSSVSTEDLREELSSRQKREDEERHEAFRRANPCPECGGDPVEVDTQMVEEFRFAPRDEDGSPRLYADYRTEGTTRGARYERTLTCVNGHRTHTDEVVWFGKPLEGPAILSP